MKTPFSFKTLLIALMAFTVITLAWCSKTPDLEPILQDETQQNEQQLDQPIEVQEARRDASRVVKYETMGHYEIFTLDLTSETPSSMADTYGQVSCDGYGHSECVNVIRKDGRIIYQNTPVIDSDEQGYMVVRDAIGSFKYFTQNGAVFSIVMGEGGPCGWGLAEFLTYYHFPTGQLFYGTFGESESGKNGECCDEGECPEIERVKETFLSFYDEPYRWANDERQALDVSAGNIEEAFYQYYGG